MAVYGFVRSALVAAAGITLLMAPVSDSRAEMPGVTSGSLPDVFSIRTVTSIQENGDLLIGLDTELPTYARIRDGAVEQIVDIPLGDVPGMTTRPLVRRNAHVSDIAVDDKGRAVFVGSYSQTDVDNVTNRIGFVARRQNYDQPETLEWLVIPDTPAISETYLYDADITGKGIVIAGKGELRDSDGAVPVIIELPDAAPGSASVYRIGTGWIRAGVRGIDTREDGRWHVVGWRSMGKAETDHAWIADVQSYTITDANGEPGRTLSGLSTEIDLSPGFQGTAFGVANPGGILRPYGQRLETRRLWIKGVDIPDGYGLGGGGTVRGIQSLEDGSVWVAGTLRGPEGSGIQKAFVAELTDTGLAAPTVVSDSAAATAVLDMTRMADNRLALVGRTKPENETKWNGWWAIVDPRSVDGPKNVPLSFGSIDALDGPCTLADGDPLTPDLSGVVCFDVNDTIETVLELDAPDRIGFALRAAGGTVGMTIFDADGVPRGSSSAGAGLGAYLVASLDPGKYSIYLFSERGAGRAILHPISGVKALPLATRLDQAMRTHIRSAGYRLPSVNAGMVAQATLPQRVADFQAGLLLIPTGTITYDIWLETNRPAVEKRVAKAVEEAQRTYRLMQDPDHYVFGAWKKCGKVHYINYPPGPAGVCFRDIEAGAGAGFFVGSLNGDLEPEAGVQWIPEDDANKERFLIGPTKIAWKHADVARNSIDLEMAVENRLLPADIMALAGYDKDEVLSMLFISAPVKDMINRAQ